MKTMAHRVYGLSGATTERISLTSVAVCVGILVWVLANAYLAQA